MGVENFAEEVQISQGGAKFLQGVRTPPLDPAMSGWGSNNMSSILLPSMKPIPDNELEDCIQKGSGVCYITKPIAKSSDTDWTFKFKF